MAHLSEEVEKAANRLGLVVERLAVKDADALRRRIAARFSLDPNNLLAYHRALNAVSIHDPAAWSWVSDFLGQSEVYLLFDHRRDPDVLRIASGTMVVPVLKETTGFVFYLAPKDGSYLLSFNEHDCLIGLGTSADWVAELVARRRAR